MFQITILNDVKREICVKMIKIWHFLFWSLCSNFMQNYKKQKLWQANQLPSFCGHMCTLYVCDRESSSAALLSPTA